MSPTGRNDKLMKSSRRTFLKSAGGFLAVSFGPGITSETVAAVLQQQEPPDSIPILISNSWIPGLSLRPITRPRFTSVKPTADKEPEPHSVK